MTASGRANHGLRDEIKAYWSVRAETFDTQPGHEIFSEAERRAWLDLLRRHIGEGQGRRALDLACGTAVISHLLDDLGFDVTGMDWAEPMLERARAKAKTRGRKIRFLTGDAENTMEPDDVYDVVVNRHLVWTLVDPLACFKEWRRVLKPGGMLLVVDGDFVNTTVLSRVFGAMAGWISRLGGGAGPRHGAGPDLAATHRSILSRVHFSNGARAGAVADMLAEAGFRDIVVDANLAAIHRAQRADFGLLRGLERAAQHRYVITARR
ncbi:ubiquinone/menaquinone biosynthesis C-methylase UbiE [Rhizobium sp. SG_E_25_P2]|uniref:class I SAM-dependent methyltransferase n=1 Tax=Rhizobium sp. SG_E_25_P2 TaxID=2879942 RepID=UPI0024732346|nr:methyltransferase domain-containing protein [Rhizobium sp. SG_E_25_P2]MDH6267840.1 ubiquinone/menaquinone biosynthesis C-methylase UbiE [Rhizobium sp. SG_E_25_P2]